MLNTDKRCLQIDYDFEQYRLQSEKLQKPMSLNFQPIKSKRLLSLILN